MVDIMDMKKTVVSTLKDYGIDWILEERQASETDKDFENLVEEIIVALLGKVCNSCPGEKFKNMKSIQEAL